jgi:polyhydroxyalkanoate synthesis regulator phasin
MLDIIKKTILAGVGATVTTKEKVESVLHDFVEKGKISSEEAKEVADKIVADGRRELEEAKDTLSANFEEILRKANLVTRKELDALEERVSQLESPPDTGQ